MIISNYDIANAISNLVSFTAVLVAAYTASFLTIAASVFLASRVPGTSLYVHGMKSLSNNKIVPVIESQINSSLVESITVEELEIDENIQINHIYKSATSTVNVLNTSFFLVSILACNEKTLICDKTDDLQESETTSWDWWNNSLMIWLSDISRINEFGKWSVPDNYYKNFAYDNLLDMSIANKKILQLEDKIHKATKLRIQEQIERSWHEEWTDTIYTTIGSLYPIISIY